MKRWLHAPAAALCGALLTCGPLVAAEPPAKGGEEKVQVAPPEAAAKPMAEMSGLQVSAGTVWRIERVWLQRLKQENAKFELPAAERVQRRKDIATQEMTIALLQKLADDRKLAPTAEETDKELASLKEQLKTEGSSYQDYLDSICKTDGEFRRIAGASLALRKALLAQTSDADVQKFFDDPASQLPLRRCSHVLYAYQGAQNSRNPRSKDEARKLAQDAAAKARADANFDFADLARKTSDCQIGRASCRERVLAMV